MAYQLNITGAQLENRLKEVGGSMYEYNNTGTAITIGTAGNFVGWVSATAGDLDSNGIITFESNATADRLVVGIGGAGLYHIEASVSWSGSASSEVDAVIHLNGSPRNDLRLRRKLGVGGDVGNAGLGTTIELAEGDYVDLRFTSDGNGDTVNVITGSVRLGRI